jgi:hypothetical protein
MNNVNSSSQPMFEGFAYPAGLTETLQPIIFSVSGPWLPVPADVLVLQEFRAWVDMPFEAHDPVSLRLDLLRREQDHGRHGSAMLDRRGTGQLRHNRAQTVHAAPRPEDDHRRLRDRRVDQSSPGPEIQVGGKASVEQATTAVACS